MIKTQNISHEYKNGTLTQTIIKEESFIINDGEFVIITGQSGSGKTTLLKILSGTMKPTSGNVFWDDIDIYNISPNKLSNLRLKKSGFVYQDFMLIDELNVYNNLILPQKLLNKDDKELINKVIDELSLEPLLKKNPKQLSGGEKQRVAIARSLINNPQILFCDEPTGQLDYVATKEIMELLKSLNQKHHITIVLVTHEQDNLKYANRFIKYNNGRLECD